MDVPAGMCWPVMELVMAGHDYYQILTTWNLGMVLKAHRAMKIKRRLQAKAEAKANKDAGRR